MSFQHQLTVRFFDVDPVGIVFFGRVFQYCHEAWEELLASAFGDAREFFEHSPWGFPLVHVESDYERPMRVAERLTVRVELDRVGTRSLTFVHTITGSDGAVRARCKLVHAAVDRATFQPTPVPREFVDGLTRLGLVARELGDQRS